MKALPLVLALVVTPAARAQDLGQIDFPTGGSREYHEAFLRGTLLLHSFEYEDAAEVYHEAQELEPDQVMAYWGEAMTYSHPIWGEDDPEAARAVLERLAPTPEERAAKAETLAEREWLACVETLYGEGDRHARNRSYSAAMATMHEHYPRDLEVAAFYALSILGTADNGRDTRIYMRAAAVAEEVYSRDPRHPGALHYLIHSYDDPVHAPLGLRMARTYARVAPAAAHALHMPSHIFVALGMWIESAETNERSAEAADARQQRKGLSVEARGFHSLYWLAYTYLQQGRIREAGSLLTNMERDTAASGSERTRYHLAVMRASHVVATRDWTGDAARIEVDLTGLGLATAVADRFVTGMAALEGGDVERARVLLADITARIEGGEGGEADAAGALGDAACCRPAPGGGPAALSPRTRAALVMQSQLEGLIALGQGKSEAALAILAESTAMEDAMPFDFGPPVVVKPAHELFGEVLLELDRSEDARAEFARALERAPRRALSLLGLARGCARAGDADAARAAYAELASVWYRADEGFPELDEVELGAASGG